MRTLIAAQNNPLHKCELVSTNFTTILDVEKQTRQMKYLGKYTY